jgi:hypothetical protein
MLSTPAAVSSFLNALHCIRGHWCPTISKMADGQIKQLSEQYGFVGISSPA